MAAIMAAMVDRLMLDSKLDQQGKAALDESKRNLDPFEKGTPCSLPIRCRSTPAELVMLVSPAGLSPVSSCCWREPVHLYLFYGFLVRFGRGGIAL